MSPTHLEPLDEEEMNLDIPVIHMSRFSKVVIAVKWVVKLLIAAVIIYFLFRGSF